MSTGKLIEMGQIITVDEDGRPTTHPRALLITFENDADCRAAIMADRCDFTFGEAGTDAQETDALEARGQQRIDGL